MIAEWERAIAAGIDPERFPHESVSRIGPSQVEIAGLKELVAHRAKHPESYQHTLPPGPTQTPAAEAAEVMTRQAAKASKVWPPVDTQHPPWALKPGTIIGPPPAARYVEADLKAWAESFDGRQAMTAGPQSTNIVFVPYPVPVGASTDYGRAQKPPRYPQKHKRGAWKPATGIPDRAAHREAVRRLLETDPR
jgi:hypothetical protein